MTRHRAEPMHRVLVLSHLTLHEALRRRVLLAALLGGLAFLILYAVGFHFIVPPCLTDLRLGGPRGRYGFGSKLLPNKINRHHKKYRDEHDFLR